MLRRSRLQLAIVGCILLIGCSSIESIGDSPVHSARLETCNVTVYQTYQQAIRLGPIEELCIINGTSSGGFSHTVQTAINKHKSKACRCGATNVYIQSRSDSGWDVATVSLVAFRYLAQESPK
jgi:hypothetical protein